MPISKEANLWLMLRRRQWFMCATQCVGVVVYNFVEGGIHVAQTYPLHLQSLPVTFGLSAFVYSGHAVFPSIYRSMKDRSQYPRMLDTTYAIVGVAGALIGTMLLPFDWPSSCSSIS